MATAVSTNAPALTASTNGATLEVNQTTERVAALENRIQELETQITSITKRQSKVLHERVICSKLEGKLYNKQGGKVLAYNGCGTIFEISEKNLKVEHNQGSYIMDNFGRAHFGPIFYLQCPNCHRTFTDQDLVHKALNGRVTIQS